MIIDQINIRGVLALEFEHEAPISRHRGRLLTVPIAFELVQTVPRHVQRGWVFPFVQQDEHTPELGR